MSQSISYIPFYQPLDSLSKTLQDQINQIQQEQQQEQPQPQQITKINPQPSNQLFKGYSFNSTASPIVDSLPSFTADFSITPSNNFKESFQQEQHRPQLRQLKKQQYPHFSSFQGQFIDNNNLLETQPAQPINLNRKIYPQLHSNAIATQVNSFGSSVPQISQLSQISQSIPTKRILNNPFNQSICNTFQANEELQQPIIQDKPYNNNYSNSSNDIVNGITISLDNQTIKIQCDDLIQQLKNLLDILQHNQIHVNRTYNLARSLHETEKQLSILRNQLIVLKLPQILSPDIQNIQDTSSIWNGFQEFKEARVNRQAEIILNQDTQSLKSSQSHFQLNQQMKKDILMNGIIKTPPSPILADNKNSTPTQDFKSKIKNLFNLRDQSSHQMNLQINNNPQNIQLHGSGQLKRFQKYSFHESFVNPAISSNVTLSLPFDFRGMNAATITPDDQNIKNINNSFQTLNKVQKYQQDRLIIDHSRTDFSKKTNTLTGIDIINISADKEIIDQLPQFQSSLNDTVLSNLKSPQSFFLPLQTQKQQLYYSLQNLSIGKKLGYGKFANVFSAFDKQTGFHVALKQIKKQTITEFKITQDVINEICIQSQLTHPNIIQFYSAFADIDSVYLIQELASGQELFEQQKLQPYRKYTENKAACIVKQVIEALIYIRQKNVIHRDIKPENIMIDNGLIKICDFGHAIRIKDNIRRNTFCGTLEYLSPEMILSQSYDYSVDVWSVGILTYELIFGNTPFKGKDRDDTFDKIAKSELYFDGPVSFEAKDFIQKMLEKDAQKRISIFECQNHPFINMEQLKRLEQEQREAFEISDINRI